MATQSVNIPEELLAQVKEAAAREAISVDELVREALEQRLNGRSFTSVYAIARRRGQQTGITPENVEEIVGAEIAAARAERGR